jgi:bifunctional ADP-heptose synthase (sugar kinase/adenylyltransferase)
VRVTQTTIAPGMAANVNLNFENLNIIDVDFVSNPEPIIKTRYIDRRSGQHLLRVDDEPTVLKWDRNTPSAVESYDAIVISDYNKGFLEYNDIEDLITVARCPVFIDTKKTDLNRFVGAYVKINELEYNSRTSNHDKLIVTMGGKGAMYNGNLYPTTEATVTDVCGCGDTFLAALAFRYLLTKDIEAAIMFANVAAGITVQHRGNYAPTYNEISHVCLLK